MKQLGLIVVVMTAACVLDTNEVPDPETGEVEQYNGTQCPLWACGNSPEVIKNEVWEANLFGLPSAGGYHLDRAGRSRVQIWDANGTPYDLYIQNNRFFGVSHDGFWQLSGQALRQAKLRMMRDTWVFGTHPAYTMVIDNVRETRFQLGTNDPIEVYRVSWFATNGQGSKNVCNAPFPQDSKRYDDLLGMYPDELLIFAGDRFYPGSMTMSQTADYNWFNFGCAGYTLAKMHMSRNTITSQEGVPNWAKRQAQLKMFVADYCGNGKPITVSGTPIRWKTELVNYFPQPSEIEARWNQNGATCLGKPRLGESTVTFQNVAQSIQDACTLAQRPVPPPCVKNDVNDLDGQFLVSAIPQAE